MSSKLSNSNNMSSKLTVTKKNCDLPKSFQKSNYSDKEHCSSCTNHVNNNNNLQGLDLATLIKEIDPSPNSLLLTVLLQAVCQKTAVRKVDSDTQTDNSYCYSPTKNKSRHRKRSRERKSSRHRSEHRRRSRHKRGRSSRRRRDHHRRSKKRKSRKESACSPSYSDYEPENPILRLRAK